MAFLAATKTRNVGAINAVKIKTS